MEMINLSNYKEIIFNSLATHDGNNKHLWIKNNEYLYPIGIISLALKEMA
jgi:hypothetical protein